MKVMKDKNLAIEKGQVMHDKLEEFCKGFYNNESPTFAKMDFNEAWNKIKHNIQKE